MVQNLNKWNTSTKCLSMLEGNIIEVKGLKADNKLKHAAYTLAEAV